LSIGVAAGSPSSGFNPASTSAEGPSVRPVTGLGWPFPDHVATASGDLVPISVAEAVAVRAADSRPVEIAVAGWQSNATAFRFCTAAFRGLIGELENQCAYNRWLADAPEPITDWYDPPMGPAFRLAGDPIWRVPNLLEWGDPGIIHFRGASVAAVLVGHFHDPASTGCGAEEVQQCSGVFVVDSVPWVLTTDRFVSPTSPVHLHPMSVADAIWARDADDASTLAVGGWFESNTVPCPGLRDGQMPLEDCANDFTWLMASAEQLSVLNADGSGQVHPPSGPAISVVYSSTLPPPNAVPIDVILIGHFHDPSAVTCPAGARRTACGNRFVVDAYIRVTGVSSPIP
jgi:hypothetical protein